MVVVVVSKHFNLGSQPIEIKSTIENKFISL